MKTAQLTSSKNPLLKDVRRAIARGSLTSEGLCIAETFHLLEEALRSECVISAVIAAGAALEEVESRLGGNDINVLTVPDALFAEISATQANQGVMALAEPPAWLLDDIFAEPALTVVIDGIQDPGNAGAILRAAEAFGASGVLFLKGSVSPYNPKAIRASAGSVFRLPLVTGMEEGLACAALTSKSVTAYAAMPDGETSLPDVDLSQPCALIIGSEGRGVTSAQLRRLALGLRIPTSHVESLNAAMAAGILLYEARRQRPYPA